MGRVYTAILNFSVFTRYFLYVLPLAAILAIPIIVGCTAATEAKIGGVHMVWLFVWIEIVWFSLWVSKIFAMFLPRVLQFVVGVVSPAVRKYCLVLRALEIPLSLVGWALVSLLTFTPVCTQTLLIFLSEQCILIKLAHAQEPRHGRSVCKRRQNC